MKAYRIERFGAALALGDVDAPTPGPGEVRLAVRGAGVRLADVAMLAGERPPRPPLPFTPGFEATGTITALGEGVEGLKIGQAVVAFLASGGLAEEAVASAGLCAALPEGFGFEQAATLPIAYAGALMGLRDGAKLGRGKTLLVLGAGGQAGQAAIGVAKKLGAKVIAAAATEERRATAEAQGADHSIDASETSLTDAVLSLTGGKGVAAVFDPVGGDAFGVALGTAAPGARYIVAGFAAGHPPTANLQSLFARGIDLLTVNVPLIAARNPERALKALEDVIAWAAAGKIKPRIAAQFRFAEVRHALDYVKARRDTGAVIVVPD